jgi:hypothetical protein
MIIQANPGFKIAFAYENDGEWFLTVCDIVAWKIEDGKDPEPIAIDAQDLDGCADVSTIVAPDGTTDFGQKPNVATWLECHKRMIATRRKFKASQEAEARLQPPATV